MSRIVVLLSSSLVLLSGFVLSEPEKNTAQEDEDIYSFAYIKGFFPLIDLNDDGELIGFYPDVTYSICKVMKKKCVHIVYYYSNYCWDNTKSTSIALNDGWWDVCVGYMQNQIRRSMYGFVANFAKEAPAYIYVKQGASINTTDEIKNSVGFIGFRSGLWINPTCVEEKLEIPLTGRTKYYDTHEDITQAVKNGEVEAMFVLEDLAKGDDRFVRIHNEQISCALAGASMQMRKDKVHKYQWMEEGLQKIRKNGEYDSLCEKAARDGNPGCFEA